MWLIHQFPLCPFSRKVRLVLAEKGIAYALDKVYPWAAPDDFFQMNPAGRTPVVSREDSELVLCDSRAICEYFEELGNQNPMLSGMAESRAEIRRLVALFDEQFYGDVSGPLLHEKMKKRVVLRQPVDGGVLREAMRLASIHLDYIDYLVDNRAWLGGSTLSLADFAAAAQISVADYLGGIDWTAHEPAKAWYSVLKSRPSFRPLLSERMEGIVPPPHYEKVDF